MSILDLIKERVVVFDGGTGTILQEKGLVPGSFPEIWNVTHDEVIVQLHKEYFKAGCDIVKTNTFGVNGLKFSKEKNYSVEEIVCSAVRNAKVASEICNDKKGYVALDMGPTGKLLKPLGDLDFYDCYNLYKEVVLYGANAGADLILIETMSDNYEAKAAILAAKENSSLPVFVTMTFDERGKLLTGGGIAGTIAMLEGLGVDALGLNCGLGPNQMKLIFDEVVKCCSIPIIVNPNAGLPRCENGKTFFDVDPNEFAEIMKDIVEMGACIIGGCCGTTQKHIQAAIELCKDIVPKPVTNKNLTVISSYSKVVEIGENPIIIGERINPTGKSKFKQALRDKNLDFILEEGFIQQDNGAHVLDVNVGLPDINEPEMMELVIRELQSVIDLPLQIDTSNIEAMERGLRIYNGKPLINSLNGKKEVMESVFPLVKKYGGVVVALTLDENGIPETKEERIKIAKKIYKTAESYGIDKKNILIDVLAMTISSDNKSAVTTLDCLKSIRDDLGGKTILGVSNISFGLPQRELINSTFFSLALQNGLNAGIINPNSEEMMKAYYSFRALSGLDLNCMNYIEKYSGKPVQKSTTSMEVISLSQCIQKGIKEKASVSTEELLKTTQPLDIINRELVPALDIVGKGFEEGTIFLPQLLMSAEAAKVAFDVIKDFMQKKGEVQKKKEKIILATVKGDIHDIGKNIVKVLLENYGFDIIDLGKDVDPQVILETAVRERVYLIGLSALMTTTVTSMEETIKKLHEANVDCRIMVGGAVLTQEYAYMIGADHYSKDAMSSVYYAQETFLSGCSCCE